MSIGNPIYVARILCVPCYRPSIRRAGDALCCNVAHQPLLTFASYDRDEGDDALPRSQDAVRDTVVTETADLDMPSALEQISACPGTLDPPAVSSHI